MGDECNCVGVPVLGNLYIVRHSHGTNKYLGIMALLKHIQWHHKVMWDIRTALHRDQDLAAAAPKPRHLSGTQVWSTGSIV